MAGPDDHDLDRIVDDLMKMADGPDAVRFAYISQDVLRLATLWSDPSTAPKAEVELQKWADEPDGLHKRIAAHWLARARAMIDAPPPAKKPPAAKPPVGQGTAPHAARSMHPGERMLRDSAQARLALRKAADPDPAKARRLSFVGRLYDIKRRATGAVLGAAAGASIGARLGRRAGRGGAILGAVAGGLGGERAARAYSRAVEGNATTRTISRLSLIG